MSARLQATLQDLRDACGATAADLTADELVRLVHACERIDSPFAAVNAELVERPIRVCDGVTMWPITVGAYVWLTECAARWWDEKCLFFKWVTAYALINAREADAFVALDTKEKARAAVVRTALRLACHVGEVMRAINRAYGVEPFDAPRDTRETERAEVDFAALVARLEVYSGIPARDWLWGRSVRSLMTAYSEMSTLAAALFGGGKTDAKDELDRAVENLARVCAGITNRIKAVKAKHEQGT